MEVIRNDNKFNKLTHLLFPSRTLIKELIYWPTELAAAIILFVYIIQMETTTMTLYKGADYEIPGEMIKMTNGDNMGFPAVKRGVVFGISYLSPNMAFQISEYDTDLLNREYAWICLCYIIKHTFYLADFAMLFRRKLCKLHDFITPLMNIWLWIMWGIYGWIKSDEQIHGGMYLRFRKDVIYSRDLSSSQFYNSAKNEYEKVLSVYNDISGWNWLWIICAIVAASHTILWFLSLKQKRSSAYTGLALSVIAIPMQLLILHLFFKGSWVQSNWSTMFIDTTSAAKALYSAMEDYYEARWIFFIIYLSSWVGLVFAILCLGRAIICFKTKELLKGLKYISYMFFWAALLVWCLLMDMTLYHYYVYTQKALIAFHAIALFFALAIFVLSVLEKKKEGDKFYHRHNNCDKWWWSTNAEGDNNAERSSMEAAMAEHHHEKDTMKGENKIVNAENKVINASPAGPAHSNKEIQGEARPYIK